MAKTSAKKQPRNPKGKGTASRRAAQPQPVTPDDGMSPLAIENEGIPLEASMPAIVDPETEEEVVLAPRGRRGRTRSRVAILESEGGEEALPVHVAQEDDSGAAEVEQEVPAEPEPEGVEAAIKPALDEQDFEVRMEPVEMEEPAGPRPGPEPEPEAAVEIPARSARQATPLAMREEPPPLRSERTGPTAAVRAADIDIPEQFLVIALDGPWDDRMERIKHGRQGAALVGSLLLELAVRGKLKVQRDRFELEEGSTGDDELDYFAEQVAELGPVPTAQAMKLLGKWLPDRFRPWKARLQRRGWIREERTRFLGLFRRSTTTLLDEDVQAKLQNRLVRMLAGGGNPDVKSIALLGLVQASGLLPVMVPQSALAFNEKRISLLLSGKDPLHYRMDNSVHQVQDLALRTILQNVRKLQG
jgi:hypothetical protein